MHANKVIGTIEELPGQNRPPTFLKNGVWSATLRWWGRLLCWRDSKWTQCGWWAAFNLGFGLTGCVLLSLWDVVFPHRGGRISKWWILGSVIGLFPIGGDRFHFLITAQSWPPRPLSETDVNDKRSATPRVLLRCRDTFTTGIAQHSDVRLHTVHTKNEYQSPGKGKDTTTNKQNTFCFYIYIYRAATWGQ